MTAATEVQHQIGLVGSDEGRPIQIIGVFALVVAVIGLASGAVIPALAIALLLSVGGLLVAANGDPLTVRQSTTLGLMHVVALLGFVLI